MLFLSRFLAGLSISIVFAVSSMVAVAADDQKAAINPLRLSYVNGQVSFWRYGAEDWVEARLNTPLAVGDALYVGSNSELELQAESRAFIRADDDTQLSLVNQTPDFLQVKITSGRVSFDLRTLPSSGYTIEVDTPNAVFTIDHTGYYRVDVDGEVHFITRRGGKATMIPAGGTPMSILPSEEIVVQGTQVARAETYVAPEPDQWDRWNYDRTNDLVDAFSDRYLPSGIAGARDLDHYGNWRVMPEYGPVWIPDSVAYGWAPYSTGRWIWDPYYQWTWIDDAPWGWAPFHYGRWIYVGGYWAWVPGPVIVRRPVYAPALVAFFGISPNVSIGLSFGGSGVGWVALSWGEPCVPWWGHRGFVGRPWWGGWNGPRVVNKVVIKQTTVVNITNIVYANSHVTDAVIATSSEHFGRGHVRDMPVRLRDHDRKLDHIRGELPVKPNSVSAVGGAPKGARPPEQIASRPVVATRRPQEIRLPWRTEAAKPIAAEQRYVPAPKPATADLRRPEFGTQTGPERTRPPLPPRYQEWERQAEAAVQPSPKREQRSVARPESEPTRVAPPETSVPTRTVREPSPPSPVQGRIPQERQVLERPAPERQVQQRQVPESRIEKAMPKEAQPREPVQRAERQRAELPGTPANRIYRGGGADNSDKRRSQSSVNPGDHQSR